MTRWFLKWVEWIGIRVVFTLVCLWTMQNIVHKLGYFIPFPTLIVSALMMIIAIRLWGANPPA